MNCIYLTPTSITLVVKRNNRTEIGAFVQKLRCYRETHIHVKLKAPLFFDGC